MAVLTMRTQAAAFSQRGVKVTRAAKPCRATPTRRLVITANLNQHHHAHHHAELARNICAVKTPFMPNGHIDLGAYEEHLNRLAQSGVEGVLVGGTTGEGHLMSWDEHLMLIAWTVTHFGDKLTVIGNTGSNSTREAVHATEQGFAVGMDAALQINPYYGKTSTSGLLTHFEAVLAEGPTIVYNVPGRTGQDIPDDVIMHLAKHEHFLGVKECTGNTRILNYAERGVRCWSGNDDQCHEGRHKFRGHGVISVAANLAPGAWSQLMGPDPNYGLEARMAPLVSWLFHEPNPIPLNTAMAMCGLCKPVFRAPYTFCSRESREKGAEIMRQLLPYLPGVEEVRVMEDSEFQVVTAY